MTSATQRPGRRRLVLFRAVQPGVVDFLRAHVSEQERCLGLDFDVTVVSGECDYDAVCDTYQPDIAVFEFGVDSALFRIANTDTHPDVPKLGYLHCDPYDNARAAFVAQTERWGVDAYFTHSVAMGEYFPDLRPFYWPNFIDPAVFHPYEGEKTIPVLVTGAQIPLYPWRNRVIPELTARIPSFVSPHPGWRVGARPDVIRYVGEDYARLLSRSTFVPACGNMTKDVVRKHFEIPAAGSCLVTEDTASMRAAGFEDMRNCVFAEADDVLDKVEHLLTHPDELAEIVAAGQDLVHRRHTIAQRGQVAQWLDAHLARAPEQSIVQDDPFAEVRLSEAPVPDGGMPVVSGGVDRALVTSGWERLAAGDTAAAATAFARAIGYFDVPEAEVGLTWATLHAGAAVEARERIDGLLGLYAARFGALEPDPVQWATRVRALLCCGDLTAATRALQHHPSLAHLELRRLRRALVDVSGTAAGPDAAGPDRTSVVQLPSWSEDRWRADLASMLVACGQPAWADRLVAGASDRSPTYADSPGSPAVRTRGPRRARRWAGPALGRLVRAVRRRLPARLGARVSRVAYVDARHNALLDAVERRPGRALYIVAAGRFDRWAWAVARRGHRNPYLHAVRRVRCLDPGTVDLDDAFVYLAPDAAAGWPDAGALATCQIVIVNGTRRRAGLRLLGALRAETGLDLVAGVPDEGEGVAILQAARPASLAAFPEYPGHAVSAAGQARTPFGGGGGRQPAGSRRPS